MAIVKGPFQLSGSVSNVSFYTRKGSDVVIMRSKGGAKLDKVKRLPQFKAFREQQKEWTGATRCASIVRCTFGGLHRLADYNLSPVLNSICNKVQKCDTVSPAGRRRLAISEHKELFNNFHFNRTYPFNSVLRVAVDHEVVRQELRATVKIGRIMGENELLNGLQLPYFRLVAALGTVSDATYDENLGDYKANVPSMHGLAESVSSDWYPALSIVEGIELSLKLSDAHIAQLTDEVTLFVSVGVEFGKVSYDGRPVEVKHAGSGKVLGVY